MKKKYYFVAALLFMVAVFAWLFTAVCRSGEDRIEEQKLLAVTSFYPVYIAAVNVIGDCKGIEVQNLSEPQTGCLHDFQLTPEDMKLLSTADVFLVNGGGMESFLGDVTEQYPKLVVVETAEGLEISEDNAHVWMSICRYRSQVAAILDKLCEMAPEYAQELKENAQEYDGKLANLEEQQEEIRIAAEGRNVISFHDAYAYLAEDYGFLVSYSINLDEERQVSAKETADVLKAVRKHKSSFVIAEELYGKALSDMIQKEADVKVYYLDTLVRGEDDKNSYIRGMQNNIELLKAAFGV